MDHNNQCRETPPPSKPMLGEDTIWTDDDPDGGIYDIRIKL